ncbi:hypothetical protein FKV24_000605 [Lysobacter maris]|uniref:Uncharacterized protein n=1 Tax=Marilutibacter maris TaxID=1605891 RepID=A0A508B787_9GAMM|nr:hypothetical protein [Lysobacter maris]KAB8198699.1 hypothetical protein FKV24_000605 [Lysobacter maris]
MFDLNYARRLWQLAIMQFQVEDAVVAMLDYGSAHNAPFGLDRQKEGGLAAPIPWCCQPSEHSEDSEHRQQKSDRQTEFQCELPTESSTALPAG